MFISLIDLFKKTSGCSMPFGEEQPHYLFCQATISVFLSWNFANKGIFSSLKQKQKKKVSDNLPLLVFFFCIYIWETFKKPILKHFYAYGKYSKIKLYKRMGLYVNLAV